MNPQHIVDLSGLLLDCTGRFREAHHRLQEEHQIALELEAKLRFMTERCKGVEARLARIKRFYGDLDGRLEHLGLHA